MASLSTNNILIATQANAPVFIRFPAILTAASTTTTGPGALVTTTTIAKQLGHQIPSDILDDLASRFIINVPDDERNNLIRICFQIELAHWFYLDFFCSIEEKKLVPCGMKQFATHLFEHIPFLRKHLSGIDKILEDWKEYKLSVPTYGAILMSEDLNHVLLVQSYWAKSSWGFPKGKVNEHEDPIHCAAREVFEETGYDISDLIVPSDYIEAVINYQYTRLYLVRNVPLKTLFTPRTRKEIKCCEWFPVELLPINKSDQISKTSLGINANSFFMIMPFIKRLKKWLQDNRLNSNNIDKQHQSVNGFALNIKNSSTTLQTNLSTTNSSSSSTLRGKRQRHKSMGDLDGIKFNLLNNSNMNGSKVINCATGKTSMTTAITTTTAAVISSSLSSSSSSAKAIIGLSCSKSSSSIKQMNLRRQFSNGNNNSIKNTITNSSNGYFDKKRKPSNIVASKVNGKNLKENERMASNIIKSSNNINHNDINKKNPVLNEQPLTIPPASNNNNNNTPVLQENEQQQENMKIINKPSFLKCNKFNSWPNFTFSRYCITNVFC